MKKLFATILAVTMLISIITVPAFAETDNDLGIETIGTDDTQTPCTPATFEECLNYGDTNLTYTSDGWSIGDTSFNSYCAVANSHVPNTVATLSFELPHGSVTVSGYRYLVYLEFDYSIRAADGNAGCNLLFQALCGDSSLVNASGTLHDTDGAWKHASFLLGEYDEYLSASLTFNNGSCDYATYSYVANINFRMVHVSEDFFAYKYNTDEHIEFDPMTGEVLDIERFPSSGSDSSWSFCEVIAATSANDTIYGFVHYRTYNSDNEYMKLASFTPKTSSDDPYNDFTPNYQNSNGEDRAVIDYSTYGIYDMAYNYYNHYIYAVGWEMYEEEGTSEPVSKPCLFRIDPEVGNVDLVNYITVNNYAPITATGIAIDPDGNAYVVCEGGNEIYSINLSTARLKQVGLFIGGISEVGESYFYGTQSMHWDMNTNTLLIAANLKTTGDAAPYYHRDIYAMTPNSTVGSMWLCDFPASGSVFDGDSIRCLCSLYFPGELEKAGCVPGSAIDLTTDYSGARPYWKSMNGMLRSDSECWSGVRARLSTTVDLYRDEYLNFEYLVRGEIRPESGVIDDGFYVYIDGELVHEMGIQPAWKNFSYLLTAGRHTIEWHYSKDTYGNQVGDYAALRNIMLAGTDIGSAVDLCGSAIEDSVRFDFDASGDYPFRPVNDPFYGLVLRSSNMGRHNTTSSVEFSVNVDTGDHLHIDYAVGGEVSESGATKYDCLQFYVDGSLIETYAEEWPDDSPEIYYSFTESGDHTIKLTYKKDSSVNGEMDYALIYGIQVISAHGYDCLNTMGSDYCFEFYYDSHGGLYEYCWEIECEQVMSGNRGRHNSSAYLATTINTTTGGVLQFDYMVNGEQSSSDVYDYLKVTLDGSISVLRVGYSDGWQTAYIEIPSGNHTIEFIYSKDSSVTEVGDCAKLACFIFRAGASGGLLGDVDGSGTLDLIDAMLLNRYMLGLVSESALDLSVADMNGDGNINNFDALLIARRVLGIG